MRAQAISGLLKAPHYRSPHAWLFQKRSARPCLLLQGIISFGISQKREIKAENRRATRQVQRRWHGAKTHLSKDVVGLAKHISKRGGVNSAVGLLPGGGALELLALLQAQLLHLALQLVLSVLKVPPALDLERKTRNREVGMTVEEPPSCNGSREDEKVFLIVGRAARRTTGHVLHLHDDAAGVDSPPEPPDSGVSNLVLSNGDLLQGNTSSLRKYAPGGTVAPPPPTPLPLKWHAEPSD